MDKLILELPDFVPKDLCRAMIDKFENDNRKYPGIVICGGKQSVIPDLKNSTELFFSRLKDWKCVDDEVSKYIIRALKIYFEFIKEKFEYNQVRHPFDTMLKCGTSDIGYSIQKTEKGSSYAWHHDGEMEGLKRMVNIMIYLNTLHIEDDGTTEFSNGRKVRPECGKVLIFPSSWTFPHCGNKVKNRDKYTCITMVNLVV